MRIFFYDRPEGLGEGRSRTPQGWLLLRAVPIARTGPQLYGPGETPLDGELVIIERDPEEVFRPETIASVEDADVVDDHPIDDAGERCDVTFDNWRSLTVGHARNPRQGDGIDDDMLLADLVIKDPKVIDELERPGGKRQISMGYSADWEPLGPGRGRQKNIVCNHIAIVDAARCGARCAIGDSIMVGLPQELCGACGNPYCHGNCPPPVQRRRTLRRRVATHVYLDAL